MNYFVFEGVDGTGKSTVMAATSRMLSEIGVRHVLTKEPGGPEALWLELQDDSLPYGNEYKSLRELCVNDLAMPPAVKRALFKADSMYNWAVTVKPALDDGCVVLSDRGWPSNLAYGTAHGKLSLDDLYAFDSALCREQVALTNVIYVTADRDLREERMHRSAEYASNEYDGLDATVRDAVEAAYELVLGRFFDPGKVLRVENNASVGLAAEIVAAHILNILDR